MSLPDHFIFDDQGVKQNPTTPDEWNDWVSATKTYNYAVGNPLLDWLDLYGEDHGYERDKVDETTDYANFVMAKGVEFEAAVIEYLRRENLLDVITVGSGGSSSGSLSLDLAAETWELMQAGVEAIHQGVLRDPQYRVYGRPDLLVRSDKLEELYPGHLSDPHASADKLGIGDRHYVVVDIKFSTLGLVKNGTLNNSSPRPANKAQLFIYNRALDRAQGYRPDQAFLLGRGWKQGEETGDSFLDRLGPVNHNDKGDLANQAVAWIRDVRRDGGEWVVSPVPSNGRLRPSVDDNGLWSGAVKKIIGSTEDPIAIYQIGPGKRDQAAEDGVTSWRDPRATLEAFGIKESSAYADRINAILDTNRSTSGNLVNPSHIAFERDVWHPTPDLEFYVDFETVSNLNDDFTKLPYKGGQPLIFMIGCGHNDKAGEWQFKCFTADALTVAAEQAIITEWLEHMAAVEAESGVDQPPKVHHWSNAELSSLNAAIKRHPERSETWSKPAWYDLIKVFQGEPVTVKGAFEFGLKAVASAMYEGGLIPTRWPEGGVADGMGAMVGAWRCQEEVDSGKAERLIDTDLMRQIEAYNLVDCKSMMEILQYIRQRH